MYVYTRMRILIYIYAYVYICVYVCIGDEYVYVYICVVRLTRPNGRTVGFAAMRAMVTTFNDDPLRELNV